MPALQPGRDSIHETSMTVRRREHCVMCITSSPTSSPMSSVPIMVFREDTFNRTWTSTHTGIATVIIVWYSIPFSTICAGADIRENNWSSSLHLRWWRWRHRPKKVPYGSDGDSKNIIYNLRRKMAINSTSINYIQTLVGYG